MLVGRNVPSPGAAAVVRELEARSIAVSVLQADVSCRNDVCGIVERLDRDGTRLRGVFHAAGVLDDGMLHQQEWSRFARVLAPKLDGAWNLHEATQQRDLDLFVLFSAGATLLGTAGQSSYVAANAFLDGLAHWRRANHLPALSVNWGRWTQVGMAAALSDEHQTRLADQGLVGIEPAAGVEALERALTLKIPQVAVLRFDRAQLAARRRQHAIVPTLVSELTTAAEPTPSPTVPETIRTQVEQTPPSQRRGLLLAHVRERVGRILQLDPSRTVDPRQPLTEIGLDSLMAVELRNALVASTGAPLAPTLLFDYPTLDRLVEHLLTDHFTPSAPPTPNGAPDAILAAHSATVRQLEQLSDDEAEQLLLAELGLTR